MKKSNYLQWLTALLLFFTFIFNASFTNERLEKTCAMSMDNTIYQYNDGDRNNSFFYISPAGNCIMEYEPFTAAAHTDDQPGGRGMVITAISMADYNYLVQLLKVAISTGKVSSKETQSACGWITVITGKQKKYLLGCGSDTRRTVDSLVNSYRKKYTVTTGKAAPQEQPLVVSGTIREEFYESKKGIITSVKEYFFDPSEEERSKQSLSRYYFIKLWGGRMLKDEVMQYAGKKVWVTAYFKNGLWDANDSQHASRIGDYISLLSIAVQ